MSRVGLVVDAEFERHDTGPGHPERPARIAAVRRSLETGGLAARAVPVPLEDADDALLALAHDPAHVARIERACASGERVVDSMDTAVGPDSARVARLAAGSVAALCREVARGRLDRGFAAVRPPGHHAERDLAMGFCLFNYVAVAARARREREGVPRVAVVDWDVHHGNGTQHAFEEDPSVFYFSLHQMPLYPGTGAAAERGRGAGLGATLNVPLRPGDGDREFLGALRDAFAPAMEAFRPEFVLVSSGFDAHVSDPLGGLAVSTEAYGEATRIVRGIADRYANGRVVSVLEGGYDLGGLAACAAEHFAAMLA